MRENSQQRRRKRKERKKEKEDTDFIFSSPPCEGERLKLSCFLQGKKRLHGIFINTSKLRREKNTKIHLWRKVMAKCRKEKWKHREQYRYAKENHQVLLNLSNSSIFRPNY